MTFRILSLDGGGIRGVVAATMLARIEQQINVPLNQYFQLVAGTSTGSILAAAIANGRSAKELIGVYQQKGSRIFPYQNLWSPERLGLVFQYGLSAPKYSDKGLVEVLKEEFKYKKLSEVKATNLLIPSYDTINREPIIFKSWRKKFLNVPLWEVCVCSASAPAYFPAHQLIRREEGKAVGGDAKTIVFSKEASEDDDDYNRMRIDITGGTGRGQVRTIIDYVGKTRTALVDAGWDVIPDATSTFSVVLEYSAIDGGVAANNPTACAIAEALRLGHKVEDISLLSIGTGSFSREIPLESAKEWGAAQWALPVIDVIFDASSDINDYIGRQIIERYLRLQFKLDRSWTGKRLSDDIDDASQENIRNLIEAADAYVKNSQVQKAITNFL
ncbi:patatin-like phospholipase family protein [Microcoleus sp. FACHB-SPT15]|uniref:patatin-like phospholipase family protein n=1 Tax=Microcoleus sp. FACHB-SPT15 TaxID=2692830 RepID=UPI0017844D54|nr:patatin-like phospholipase family protein [Microcoleus sp. FACHB-SPT15]MBD1806685.1 patatin-like phospholipase family protein [Microcoleus sp. FACHB-SPT15]